MDFSSIVDSVVGRGVSYGIGIVVGDGLDSVIGDEFGEGVELEFGGKFLSISISKIKSIWILITV